MSALHVPVILLRLARDQVFVVLVLQACYGTRVDLKAYPSPGPPAP